MRRCRVCDQEKPLDQFGQAKGNKDGLSWRCRDCARAYYQAYHVANREKRVARIRAWQTANPERVRELRAAHNAQPEVRQARREESRQRYASDPVAARQYQLEWQRQNPGAKQIASLKLRLKRLGREDEPVFTVDEWTGLCEQFGNRCAACQGEGPLTVDHVVPISRGGASTIDNIQPLCKPCNDRKHTKVIDYRVPQDDAA